MVIRLYPFLRRFALFVGAVVAGSVLCDIDHILPPFQRSGVTITIFLLLFAAAWNCMSGRQIARNDMGRRI
jgi:hypothetical protein